MLHLWCVLLLLQLSEQLNATTRFQLKARQKEIFKQNGASPLLTMAIAPITQLPVFVLTSLTISRCCVPPSVLDGEAFLTLTSLVHGDPTLALPIILGITTLANVETARWFISPEALEREKKVDEWKDARRARGETVIEPKKIIQTSLRTMAVCRILIAALVPGVRLMHLKSLRTSLMREQAVQLYWVTSAAFGLAQTWSLDWLEMRRRRARASRLPAEGTDTTPPSPEPAPASTIVFKAKRSAAARSKTTGNEGTP